MTLLFFDFLDNFQYGLSNFIHLGENFENKRSRRELKVEKRIKIGSKDKKSRFLQKSSRW